TQEDTVREQKTPAITLMKLRFIARHMMYERIAPLEPTSAPVTISRSLDSMKPGAAAAEPEWLFGSDPTTGMSAPPIAITMWMPKSSAIAVIRTSGSMPLSMD